MPDSANGKIANLAERAAIGLLGFVMSVMFLVYQGQRNDFKDLEAKVYKIEMDKASREDVRDLENRINRNFDARIAELRSQATADKSDILARLDLYLKKAYQQ